MVDKELVERAAEMTKNIPANDVLVPLQTEEKDLTPYPKSEYDVVMEMSLDKFKRKVNQMIWQGRMPTGWVNVISTSTGTRFYQSMERRNVDRDEDQPVLHIDWLEDEPDLYDFLVAQDTNWENSSED